VRRVDGRVSITAQVGSTVVVRDEKDNVREFT